MIKKKNFVKKVSMLCMVGALTIGQSFNTLAAQHVYSAERVKGNDFPSESRITSNFIGRMNTTFSAYLGIQVNGIYTIRGGSPQVAAKGADFFQRSLNTQVSAMAEYSVTVDSHMYYCAVRCLGYYAYSPGSAVSCFAFEDIYV